MKSIKSKEPSLKLLAKKFSKQLKKIKVVVLDVDGILTNGQVFWNGVEVGFNRIYYVPDGYGIKVLLEAGIEVGIITGGNSESVKRRFELLKIPFIFAGNEDKREGFLAIKKAMKCEFSEMLYMGDEHFDIPLLKKAGFAATVDHANDEVKKVCDYITTKPGGFGAVREVIDMLRYAQGIVPHVPDFDEK